MQDRKHDRGLDPKGPVPPEADPAASSFPIPVPWISPEPGSKTPPVRGPASRCPTLRSLEMSGSYPLSDEAIDHALTRRSPGNYALGYMDGDTFRVFYVGRSDSDVRGRLHEWVGMPSPCETYASAAKAAWSVHRRGALPGNAPAPGHVGNAETGYTRFAYSYARSADEAYAKEWRNYDAFGGRRGLDNQAQPMSTAG